MNIQGFSMIEAAYINPNYAGDPSAAEWAVWWIERVFVDYKFLGIFSLLFGAGIGLLSEKVEQSGGPVIITHYRRMIVLAIIGGLHATLIWYGDILLSYALIGAGVFLFRKLPARLLLLAGIVFSLPGIWEFIEAQQAMHNTDRNGQLAMASSFWVPSLENVINENTQMRGSWLEVHAARLDSLNFMLGYLFLKETLWKTGSFMLIGLALYKLGFFSSQWRRRSYLNTALFCIPLGLVIAAYGLWGDVKADFDISYSLNTGRAFLYASSVPQAIGYAAIAYWAFSFKNSEPIRKLVAPIGRMALTNYIMQSIICTLLFYGWGLGLFGTLGRVGQLAIVIGVWILQIFLSHVWLNRFAYGPLEWAWRWGGKGKRPAFIR